jgi:phosphate transport system substrate-binding protein
MFSTKNALALGLSVVALAGAGCSSSSSSTNSSTTAANSSGATVIRLTGSDTMVNLNQAWAENYKKVKPEVSIQVAGGGSGVGIAGLINGTLDIAAASREITPEEMQKATQAVGSMPQEVVVGLDALAVYVHKDNPAQQMSIDELAEIYGDGGTITKWSQLGVKNTACTSDEIVRVSRQNNSGTYAYFRVAILGTKREYKLGSVDQSGSKDVVTLVGRTPCAIGYSGMAYLTPDVHHLKISKKKGETTVEPTLQTAIDRTYPIARALYFYTHGTPSAEAKAFIDWTLGADGQKIVQDIGFVPAPKK